MHRCNTSELTLIDKRLRLSLVFFCTSGFYSDPGENGSSWGSAYAKCYARRQEKFRRNEKAMANIQGKIPKSEQLFKAIQQGKVEMVSKREERIG